MTAGQFVRYHLIEALCAAPFFMLFVFTNKWAFFFLGMLSMPIGAIILLKYVVGSKWKNEAFDTKTASSIGIAAQ